MLKNFLLTISIFSIFSACADKTPLETLKTIQDHQRRVAPKPNEIQIHKDSHRYLGAVKFLEGKIGKKIFEITAADIQTDKDIEVILILEGKLSAPVANTGRHAFKQILNQLRAIYHLSDLQNRQILVDSRETIEVMTKKKPLSAFTVFDVQLSADLEKLLNLDCRLMSLKSSERYHCSHWLYPSSLCKYYREEIDLINKKIAKFIKSAAI